MLASIAKCKLGLSDIIDSTIITILSEHDCFFFIILQPVLAMATSREHLPLEGAKSGIFLTIFSKYVGVFS